MESNDRDLFKRAFYWGLYFGPPDTITWEVSMSPIPQKNEAPYQNEVAPLIRKRQPPNISLSQLWKQMTMM